MCPYYLDGDRTELRAAHAYACETLGPVIPVICAARLIESGDAVATVQFSRTAGRSPGGTRQAVSQNSTACTGTYCAVCAGEPGQVRSTF